MRYTQGGEGEGITINLGFSHQHPMAIRWGVDVPGLKILSTPWWEARSIDVVLLVIAADKGIMPQTIEHINIITAWAFESGCPHKDRFG